MECPHVEACVKIVQILPKKQSDSDSWTCTVCNSDQSPWICLSCGIVHCGRYVNGHGKSHYEDKPDHVACMECNTYATFCYACDEFVISDTETKQLEQVRNSLKAVKDHSAKLRNRKRQSSEGDENDDSKSLKKKAKTKANNKAKIVGLRNLGNTCFMNAVLQSLSNIQQFSGYFKQLPALDSTPVKNGRKPQQTRTSDVDTVLLAEELRKILILLWKSGKGAISPESLFTVIWKVVPRFRGYQQQDAHEFLRYMLDRLHIELLGILPISNNPRSNYTISNLSVRGKSTIVTSIFGGILQSEVNCLVCGTESKKHDPFLDLSLDLPSHMPAKTLPKQKDGSEGSAMCSLYDCLNSFTELEKLADSEQYFCSNCKCRQQSTKKFWIRRLPNVLCLHLKRFRWSNFLRTKLDNYVEFPVKDLDMTNYLLTNMHGTRGSGMGSCLYDLAAVIVHHGSGVGSGHYTAYGTHEGNWYHFNDSSVTICDEETVQSCKAYILFYIKREIKVPTSLISSVS